MLKLTYTDSILVITLTRPNVLNALCSQMRRELSHALQEADTNEQVSAVVITGSDKAFAAGADVSEMLRYTQPTAYQTDIELEWADIRNTRKPVIAAVSGYALGGGSELAMMCDIVIASETAQFGTPEISLGTMSGSGGTQRLTRTLGKYRAMEMILTGKFISANEACRLGLVSRVVQKEKLISEALETAKKISRFSQPVVMLAKEAVKQAYEATLQEGLSYEKRLFEATFGLEDRREGMAAFIQKRQAEFANK